EYRHGVISGPTVLTIAAILLITSAYLYLAFTTRTPTYEELISRSIVVPAEDTTSIEVKNLEKEKQYEITVWISHYLSERPTKEFQVTLSDHQGKIVETTVTNSFAWTIDTINGTLTIAVKNPSEESLTLTIRVVDVTRVERRPFEQLSQWLALITIPIIILGIYLLRYKKSNATKF
ncbi:MAG: hypothetical protein QXQ37_00320, partial [Nitrososphaerota archaeon]